MENYHDIIKSAVSELREAAQKLRESNFTTLMKEEQSTVMEKTANALQATEELFSLFAQQVEQMNNAISAAHQAALVK